MRKLRDRRPSFVKNSNRDFIGSLRTKRGRRRVRVLGREADDEMLLALLDQSFAGVRCEREWE